MSRIIVRVLNAQGVSERRPQDEIEAGILKAGFYGDPDVWLLSEIAWADLEAIANKHGLHALQSGPRGSADAGVGILSRLPIAKAGLLVGTLATSEGRGVRMRPLVTGRTYGMQFTAGHAPPPTSPVARSVYIARARLVPGVVGCDWNQPVRWMEETSRRNYRGIGVLGVLVPKRYGVSHARPVDVDSDHAAVDVMVIRPAR